MLYTAFTQNNRTIPLQQREICESRRHLPLPLCTKKKNRNSDRLGVFSQLLNNAKIMTSKSGLALTATVLQIRSFSAVLVQACMILPQTCLSVKQTQRRRKKIKEIKFSKSLSQNVYPAVLLDVPRCYALHVREFVGLLPQLRQ